MKRSSPLVQWKSRSLGLPVALLFTVSIGGGSASFAFDALDFSVSGDDGALSEIVQGASLLHGIDKTSAADEVLSAALADYGRMVGALYGQGHYSPVVSIRLDGKEASGIAPLDAPGRISRVDVRVDPGPKFLFGKVDVRPLAGGYALPATVAPGQVAKSGVIREAVVGAVDGWRAIGYAKAKVVAQDVVADHRAQRLSADVTLAPGPKLRFGAVAVQGNERTRENRVRAIAGLPQGKVYDPKEITRAEARLRRTGTFASATIDEAAQVTASDLLETTIVVVEEKPRRLSFGAEVSSLEGAAITGSWMHRNLFGGAERFKVEGNISNLGAPDSGVDYGLALSIERPATITPDTTLRFATSFERLDEPDYRADQYDLRLGFSHVFSDTLTGRVDLAYAYTDGVAIAEDGVTTEAYLSRSIALPIGLTWDRRDSKTDATKGFYVDAEIKPFLGFGSTGTGARMTTDLRAYRSFSESDKFVLAGRLQAGAILGTKLTNTPRDDLFLSGGGGTVRGQPYQSLGINLLRGAVNYQVGGTYFMAGSVELRTKVTETIGIVGFVDAGRVDVDGFFSAAGDWHGGAGLGLRYSTGFGPIRLDVAAPVGGKTGKGVQIYVGLGQSF
jgi:translocation and assembly module TamA